MLSFEMVLLTTPFGATRDCDNDLDYTKNGSDFR